MFQAPIRFAPYLRPMVWGGRRLGEALGKPLPTSDAYGESWEISDHPSHHSKVVEGARPGHTLHDLMAEAPSALLGAGLVAVGDALSRSLFPPIEIPLGVLLAFVGVPTFLYLYLRPAGAARLWGT